MLVEGAGSAWEEEKKSWENRRTDCTSENKWKWESHDLLSKSFNLQKSLWSNCNLKELTRKGPSGHRKDNLVPSPWKLAGLSVFLTHWSYIGKQY